MNIFIEFLRAKSFWCKNLNREVNFSLDNFEGIESRLPKYRSEDQFIDIHYPDISLNPLKLPRHFGSKGKEQVLKMVALEAHVRMAFSSHFPIFRDVGNPQDGGSFWDRLMGRGEGDTPIAICEHLTLLNYLVISRNVAGIYPGYNNWLRQFVEYVRGYRTAQLNNHLTWKALFLATSGIAIHSDKLLREAYFLFQTAVNKIKDDGSMPLELARGEKAASYTLMNLEALIHLERIFNVKEPKIRAALADFEQCINSHDDWKRKHGLKHQIHPENLGTWNWIFMFEKKIDFDVCQNSYVSHFTGAWK